MGLANGPAQDEDWDLGIPGTAAGVWESAQSSLNATCVGTTKELEAPVLQPASSMESCPLAILQPVRGVSGRVTVSREGLQS